MTSDKTEITVQDIMAAAFQALLRGDTDTRDMLCAQLMQNFSGKEALPLDTVMKPLDKERLT